MDVKERPEIRLGSVADPEGEELLCTDRMVGQAGLEPATPRLSSACSNQLSYRPLVFAGLALVELRRLELLTSCLQSRRSTN